MFNTKPTEDRLISRRGHKDASCVSRVGQCGFSFLPVGLLTPTVAMSASTLTFDLPGLDSEAELLVLCSQTTEWHLTSSALI